MKNINDIAEVIGRIDTPEEIMVATMGHGFYIQVGQYEDEGLQWGRKWYVSTHSTESEIVQTVFKAVLVYHEHEIRERFKYTPAGETVPRAVFNPHVSVNRLYELSADSENYDVRLPV
jgi:hypothetical protein